MYFSAQLLPRGNIVSEIHVLFQKGCTSVIFPFFALPFFVARGLLSLEQAD